MEGYCISSQEPRGGATSTVERLRLWLVARRGLSPPPHGSGKTPQSLRDVVARVVASNS
jgi:hypothetical protein